MSMSLYAYKKEDDRYNFVFPDAWTQEYIYPEGFDWSRYVNDDDYELHPVKNWAYRHFLDLNLANANMIRIMYEVLGLTDESYIERNDDGDIYSFLVPVDIFLTVTQVWLQKNLGRMTPAVETYEHPRRMERPVEGNVVGIRPLPVGPRVFDCGRPEAYDENVIRQMVDIAHEGKKCGATHIGAA